MSVDLSLFLQNIYAALTNRQYQHAQFLVDYAINVAKDGVCLQPKASSFDVSIGLHQGRIRHENEDCVLVVQGVGPSQDPFGLFVVCDGMGGHDRGQEAAHLAIQTILEYVLPLIERNTILSLSEHLLVEGIQRANQAIYLRNQLVEQELPVDGIPVNTSQIHQMGTTITAALLFRKVAYIANVGDSRTYLYKQSLKKITRDHSFVAQLVANGFLQEEDIYAHPQRNQITRALGTTSSVDVDTFVVPLDGDEILLLCSDGLWEMIRDRKIEEVLASSWANAPFMVNQLVQMANDGGGADNIGCIVIQLRRRTDISAMETRLLEPIAALNRWVSAS